MLNSWINQKYLVRNRFKSKFLVNQPFPHLVLNEFFKQEKLATVLRALVSEKFQLKDSDLFTFFQTADFKWTKNKVIGKFRDFIASKEFIDFVSQITSSHLTDKIECFATIYRDTNYLLPHDDRVERRKIAYLAYLSDFGRKEGGALNFYSCQKNLPVRISKQIVPKFNTFVLFQVSRQSFHSVSEVLANKQRVTIAGWFYD